jgi:hypothetical protein
MAVDIDQQTRRRIGGAIAGLPSATQLIFAASTPLLGGALGAFTLRLTSSKRNGPHRGASELQM